MAVLRNGSLRGMGEPGGAALLAIDPGKSTGIVIYRDGVWHVNTAALDELPSLLRELLPVALVIVENYMLQARNAVQQSGSDMPSAQGIGMCRVACEWTSTDMVLVSPQIKRAGYMALDTAGMNAWRLARNDHERDAVDIMGYALREMGRKA